MKGHKHCHHLLMNQVLENRQKLQLMPDIQERSGFVQHNSPGFLAHGPRQKDALLLPVAYLRKIPPGQVPCVNQLHGLPDLFSVFCGQYAHSSGIRVTAGADHILTGHKFRVNPFCHQNGHPLCNLPLPHLLHGRAIQIYSPFQQPQLPDYASENGGFASPVWTNQGYNFAWSHMNPDLPYKRYTAVSHGHIFSQYVIFFHEIRLSVSPAVLFSRCPVPILPAHYMFLRLCTII